MWTSWARWASWQQFDPTSAVLWVDSQFWDYSPARRAMLVDVWLVLAKQWIESEPKPADDPRPPLIE